MPTQVSLPIPDGVEHFELMLAILKNPPLQHGLFVETLTEAAHDYYRQNPQNPSVETFLRQQQEPVHDHGPSRLDLGNDFDPMESGYDDACSWLQHATRQAMKLSAKAVETAPGTQAPTR